MNALLHMFVAFKRTCELKLFSVLMGGQLRSATRLCTLVSPSLPSASIFFWFHVVRTETCLTLLCRVHRYLLKSAFTVCLMGHTAVQTSVAQRVCFHLSRATQSATLSSASICRRMMCCQVERMTKDMTASAPSTLKIMVVAPPNASIAQKCCRHNCPPSQLDC